MKTTKIILPTSWSEVSIKQFKEIQNNHNDKSLDTIDIMVSDICTLSGCDYSIIENQSLSTINELYSKITFIQSIEVDIQFPNKVILGDKIYTVNPDVQMKFGQFKAIKEFTKDEDTTIDNLHKIVALFLFEENKGYDYEFDKKCQLVYDECKMDVILKLSGFFFELLPRFVQVSQNYSLQKAVKILKQIEKEIKQ